MTGSGLVRDCSVRMKTTHIERMGGGVISFILTSMMLLLIYISLKPMK